MWNINEDVKEKFDTVIEAFSMIKERLDRHEQAEEERFQRLETGVHFGNLLTKGGLNGIQKIITC
jgi:hypothetical protein